MAIEDNVIKSAVGDIHVPGRVNNTPIDTSIEFTPQNPFTIDIPPTQGEDQGVAYPGFPVETEKTKKTGFFQTAKDEFQELSSEYHIAHAANAPLTKPEGIQVQALYPQVNDKFYQPAPDGWSPKQEIEKLSNNVDPRFLPKLLATKNPNDFQYTLDSINEESTRTAELQNGSTLAKILGGGLGLTLGSIENMVPLASIATKAKAGAGFISAALKNTPGILAASAIHEGAYQMDRVDKNLPDFIKDTFIDTIFGVTFFGGIGAAKSLINVYELNKLKKLYRDSLDGIGFNFKVDKKGNLLGFEAVDTSSGEAQNAAKVTRAQEHADAAFYKGGLYKVPYVGAAAAHIISGNFGNIPGVRKIPYVGDLLAESFNYLFGSPLMQLKTAEDYPEASAFADAAFDHFITTEGEVKGKERPPSFELKMKQTRAMLTSLKAETDALHAKMNGYKITARSTLNIQNAWSAVKQKSIDTFSNESNSRAYYSKDDFMDQAQRVLYSGKSSEHGAVNELATRYREVINNAIKPYLKAYNLPEDYFRNMDTHLSRVYDTPYMQENETGINGWIPVISKYFADSDAIITARMEPIYRLDKQIKDFEAAHTEAVRELGRREAAMNPGTELVPYSTETAKPMKNYKVEDKKRLTSGVKEITGGENNIDIDHVMTLSKMRHKLKSMRENLQNELRSNPDYDYFVEDRFALSADEANELKTLLTPLNKMKKDVETQQDIVTDLKNKSSRQLAAAKKSGTVEKAKPKAEKYVDINDEIEKQEDILHQFKLKVEDEEYNLYDKARTGKMNARLYNPLTFELRNPNERLRFRDVFATQRDREIMAKSAYDSIMHLQPQDIISDVFGKMTGNVETNPLKKRTLMVPDKILYDNNFMTKDLYSKTANYVTFLAKRTHLKTSFNNVTVNGNFEELAEGILSRYQSKLDVINQRKDALTAMLEGKSGNELKSIQKQIKAENKNLRKEGVRFNSIKTTMKRLFENRMMGINRRNDFDTMARRTWMSLSAAVNLHNLPATQIGDLGFTGFQHGIWPSIRDGIYPMIESLGGILKTVDAEALREMAPSINLGFQDELNNYADRNWHSELQPYINMGKIVSWVEKYAHFSAMTDLSPQIDNGIQRINGSVIQSEFMRLLHKQIDGTISEKDSLYLVKYGIDPKVWADRMVKAYKDADGFKTKLGGYMSKVWQWQDLEASNVFNDAVFRGIQNTLIWKGMADSPFFADNFFGMFFHTFTGWTYAATNRYLIPSMQHPDGELLLKMMWMAGAGALVSPTRRISRGEDPVPEDMTWQQRAYEVWQDSGLTSTLGNVFATINFMSDDRLLGDLKNDKFKNRMKTGIFGTGDVLSSTATRISDVLGMVNSGLNEKDLKTAAHMFAVTGAMYFHHLGDKLVEYFDLPKNKQAAERQNG